MAANNSPASAGPVDPLTGLAGPTARVAPARKTVTPTQGVAWGEPVFDQEGGKVIANVKMLGRDIKVHAHDTRHALANVPVSVPAAVADEWLKRGLAREPNSAVDLSSASTGELEKALAQRLRTDAEMEEARERAANSPHTKIV